MSDSEDEYGPPLPPGLSKTSRSAESSDDDAYGPAMPPELHLDSKTSKRRHSSSSLDHNDETYGPALPTKLTSDRAHKPSSHHSNHSTDSEPDSSSDNDSDDTGSKSKRQKISIGPAIQEHLNKSKQCTDEDIGPKLPQYLSKDKDLVKEKSGSSYIGPELPPHLSKDIDSVEQETGSSYIGPELPPHLDSVKKPIAADSSNIGPELPPHFSKAMDSVKEDSSYIGPVLPPYLRHLSSIEAIGDAGSDCSEDDMDMVGPSLALQATGSELTPAAEFEMRAQKMHDKLTGKAKDPETEAPASRESWMTELPSGAGKQFGLVNRNFRRKDAPDQDSSWTDTPQDKARKEKEGSDSKKKKKEDKYYVPTEKDRETAKEIDQYNKTHRPDSLLEMHEKKIKKKKKKEKKERKKNKKEKKAEERRPFDRDLDLQVNKFDDAQRKSIIKRSQELNSRFKTGGMGTSFL